MNFNHNKQILVATNNSGKYNEISKSIETTYKPN